MTDAPVTRSPTRPIVAMSITAILLVAPGGCSYLEDTIGQLSAKTFTVKGCLQSAELDVPVNAVAIDACADLLYVRAQNARTPVAAADGIILQFTALEQLLQELEGGPVVLDVTSPRVTVTLFLNHTCPDSFASLEATAGTVTVTSLQTSTGGDLRLSATVTITDTKSGDLASPAVTIDIDASDSSYRPLRDYPVCP